jgi:L-cysteine/cystine lyase
LDTYIHIHHTYHERGSTPLSDLTHVQQIRQEMPATTAHTYLNAGTFGPLPTCVTQAIQERIQAEWRDGRLGAKAFEGISTIYGNARRAAARLLHADEQEIALTDNTGEGLNIVSYGIHWHEGDEVITTNHEHISALAPLYQLRDRYGVVVRVADLGLRADGPLLPSIQELITPRTRLIVLSHVTWTTGAVLDIRAIGRLGKERGIPVLVDGAQSAGAIPIDVKQLEVDFYAIPMQKWLCGPDGTGALYVAQDALHYINSTYVGYYSIKHEEDIEWELHDTAQRFETGGRQTAAIAGQYAVLDWLENFVGHEWQYKRIAALHTYAYHALQRVHGLKMLTPQPGASGLLAFQLEGQENTGEIVKQLNEQYNILIRDIPTTKALRVSTNFYNTEEEIDALIQALVSLTER